MFMSHSIIHVMSIDFIYQFIHLFIYSLQAVINFTQHLSVTQLNSLINEFSTLRVYIMETSSLFIEKEY